LLLPAGEARHWAQWVERLAQKRTETMSTALPPIIEQHIAAVNAGDLDALTATFDDDAYVTAEGEARGIESVRALLAKELIDDHVKLDVRQVVDHHGDFIVRAKYDGTYDKTNLPDPLILTNYYSLRNGKIVTLVVFSTPPSDADRSE
jgi:hypothetical protein